MCQLYRHTFVPYVVVVDMLVVPVMPISSVAARFRHATQEEIGTADASSL